MKHTIIALAAAGLLATALPASSAQAHCGGCGVAAGVVGGLAAGAIIGSAIARPAYVAPPPPPAYVEEPAYVEGPVCHVERRQVWVDGYGWRTRRFQVCE